MLGARGLEQIRFDLFNRLGVLTRISQGPSELTSCATTESGQSARVWNSAVVIRLVNI